MISFEPRDIRNDASILGYQWLSVYSHDAEFTSEHFEKAMMNIIAEPNINSTVIMRADILQDLQADGSEASQAESLKVPESKLMEIDPVKMPLFHSLDDLSPRTVSADLVTLERSIVRRIIPRNPLRDAIVNQSCLILTKRNAGDVEEEKKNSEASPTHKSSADSILVVYLPHVDSVDLCPFYLPPVKAVGILYHEHTVSVHYLLFEESITIPFDQLQDSERIIRIARHLLQTSHKHSTGVMDGYKKRVYHDIVVEKVKFQDKYIELKQKYAKDLVAGWVESTDPKKHVFEDLAIAAFLIELWNQTYETKTEFDFVDLGCGNGLLVYVLMMEGYKGIGIDARARKSWSTYPETVQNALRQQVIVPAPLLKNAHTKYYRDPSTKQRTQYAYTYLRDNPQVHCENFASTSFLIGNHSDELTVWIPLFDRPFIAIPCCSHSLSGTKFRFPALGPDFKSTYASLVDHVSKIAQDFGWNVEKEMLRIPSTRNAAIIGRTKRPEPAMSVHDIIEAEGGADGWVERTMSLQAKVPRDH